MPPSVQILILNYNAGEALRRCLQCLQASDAGAYPVLLVDNASQDGSPEMVAAEFPNVEIVRLAQNSGFAAGVNAGLAELEARSFDALLLLNPDTEVSATFLEPLLAACQGGQRIVGPKLLTGPAATTIWCAGGDVTFGLNLTRLRGHRQPDRGQFDQAETVTFLPATVWLMPRALYQKVGDFDESFFCYVEDVDYCLRAHNHGYELYYEPASSVYHAGSWSSGGGYTALRKYLNALGSWTFMRKHGTLRRWCTFLAFDVLTAPLALGYGLLQRRPGAAWWKIRGLIDGFFDRGFSEQRRRRLLAGSES